MAITYSAARYRVRKARGSAELHACQGSCGHQAAWCHEECSGRCGDVAEHWSAPDGPLKSPEGWTYSEDPADYIPLCRACTRASPAHGSAG